MTTDHPTRLEDGFERSLALGREDLIACVEAYRLGMRSPAIGGPGIGVFGGLASGAVLITLAEKLGWPGWLQPAFFVLGWTIVLVSMAVALRRSNQLRRRCQWECPHCSTEMIAPRGSSSLARARRRLPADAAPVAGSRSSSMKGDPVTGRRLRGISLLATATLAAFSAPLTAVAQAPAPGTYRLWLCAEVCMPSDSARAVAAATVVIVEARDAEREPVRSAFARLPAIEYASDTAAPDDVCFHVTRREPRVGSEELFFGIRPRGRTRWQYVPADGFSLRVFRSPDASYALRWTEPGPLVRGEGWSSGWAGNVGPHRNAHFAAVRIGEPDVAQCG